MCVFLFLGPLLQFSISNFFFSNFLILPPVQAINKQISNLPVNISPALLLACSLSFE